MKKMHALYEVTTDPKLLKRPAAYTQLANYRIQIKKLPGLYFSKFPELFPAGFSYL
jgi:hypothetical protein